MVRAVARERYLERCKLGVDIPYIVGSSKLDGVYVPTRSEMSIPPFYGLISALRHRGWYLDLESVVVKH